MDLQISAWDSLDHITFESLVIPDLLYFRPKVLPGFEHLLFSNRIFLTRVVHSVVHSHYPPAVCLTHPNYLRMDDVLRAFSRR